MYLAVLIFTLSCTKRLGSKAIHPKKDHTFTESLAWEWTSPSPTGSLQLATIKDWSFTTGMGGWEIKVGHCNFFHQKRRGL